MGLGHPHRKQLGPVSLNAAAHGLGDQILNLLTANGDFLEPFSSQNDLGSEGINFVGVGGDQRLGVVGKLGGLLHGGDAIVEAQGRVGGQGNGDAVEQMLPQRPGLGVVGGHQQGLAGVLKAQPLPLDLVAAGGEGGQQQVGDLVIEQVDVIDVEHTPVGGGQQPRLKYALPRLDRAGHIHRAQQAIFGHPEGNLHKGSRNDAGGQGGGVDGGGAIAIAITKAIAGLVVPQLGVGGVGVAAGALDHLNGGQQLVQRPRHD